MAGSLRSVVIRGGVYLSLRQVFGLSLNLGGMVLLSRTIGPENYGLYAMALGIFYFVQNASLGGIKAYLVRREGEDSEEAYHQAFTLLLLFSAGGTLLFWLGLPLLEIWVRVSNFGPVALAIALSLPVALLSKVPLARLERNLDYKRVAMLELSGLAAFYLIALPLAFGGGQVTAPVAGWWAQQLLTLVFVHYITRYRPHLCWDGRLVRSMLHYGLSFSASNMLFQLRQLVNPLVVGRYLGAEAAGYVALTIRLVQGLTFIKETAWRLSMPALARLQHDKSRLIRAVTEGMQLQLLALGPMLVGFGWIASWFLPFAFGDEWLPVMDIYPFIALGYLVNAVFTMHSSTLYVLRRNMKVVTFHLVHVALFAGSAFLLVPRVGLVGYGLAEVVALASYAVIHINFMREVGMPNHKLAGAWGAAIALAVFVHELGWWVAAGLVLVGLWPRTWTVLGDYARAMWRVKEA